MDAQDQVNNQSGVGIRHDLVADLKVKRDDFQKPCGAIGSGHGYKNQD